MRPHEVRHRERRLGLAEPLEDLHARVLAPELEQVGVERLAGGGEPLEGGQVVGVDVRLHHEAVHRGRAAQRRHPVAGDEREDLGRVETIEVVGEDARLHEPLAVELAPHGLAPSGVGDGEVHPVGVDAVPVLRRDDVGDGVAGVVQHHLGVAVGAAREVHQHALAGARLAPGEHRRGVAHACVEVDPARPLHRRPADAVGTRELRAARLARRAGQRPVVVARREAAAGAVHQDLDLERRAPVADGVAHVRDVADRGRDDRLDARLVDPVRQVVLLEHEGRRHHDRPQLVQGGGNEPELVVAPQDHEHAVSPADAAAGQKVRGLVAPELHVREGEGVLLALGVAPHHRAALRVVESDVVDHVVGEVEIVGIARLELREHAVGVVGLGAVLLMEVAHGGRPFVYSQRGDGLRRGRHRGTV